MKTFEFAYAEKTYRCSMNRAVLLDLERKLKIDLLSDGDILGKTYGLFYGALRTNHPEISYDRACKLLDDITSPNENGESEYDFVDISRALIEMSVDCLKSNTAKNQIKIG